jgi:hypothetical protein
LVQEQLTQSSTLGWAKATKPFLEGKASKPFFGRQTLKPFLEGKASKPFFGRQTLKPFLGTQTTHPSLCAGTRNEELVQVLGIVEQFLRSGHV